MDRSDLVISLCLDNENTFKSMKLHEIAMVLLVSKQFGRNKQIIQQRNRYRVYLLHTRFVWNISHLADVRNNNLQDDIKKCERKQNKILNIVYNTNSEIQDCFFKMMIASYKKRMATYFNFHYTTSNAKLCNLLKEYDRIFEKNAELKLKINEKHDHTHYIFAWLPEYNFANEAVFLEKWRKINP